MRKVLILGIVFSLLPCWARAASLKGYEIYRIYRDSKITVAEVTYWEYQTVTKSVPYSVEVEKSALKKYLADYPDLKLPKNATDKIADSKVAKADKITVADNYTYSCQEKKAIIAKEKITWDKYMTEKEIYAEINKRLTEYLPEAAIIPEQREAAK